MSPRRRAWLLVACLTAAFGSPPGAAHERYDEALSQLDAALAAAPGDAELWRRRAALERGRRRFARAKSDLDRAAALGLEPALADRERGLLWLESGRLRDAETALRRARERAPGDLEAVVAHARALAALERWREAADGYGRALELAPGSGPEIHLERVRALEAGGAATHAEALHAVDASLGALGAVPALAQAGVELELRAGRTDAALARLDRMAAPTRGREGWLVQRAEILERAGRDDEAASDYGAALAAIEALPPQCFATPAAAKLAARARDGIARLTRSSESIAR